MATEAKDILHFAECRIYDLEEEIEKKKEEVAVWKAVLRRLNACKECKGHGTIRVFIAQDESESRDCEKCEGKGVLS